MTNQYSNDKFAEFVQLIFDYVLKEVFKLNDFTFQVMRRRGPVSNPKRMTLGYIDLRNKKICLDIYTPKKRQPKSINSLLRTIAHEIAHFQKPPYRQRYKGRYITRQHYPAFYKQVTRNIEKIKKDPYLSIYFRT
jgi:hypothetical protein